MAVGWGRVGLETAERVATAAKAWAGQVAWAVSATRAIDNDNTAE
eukprot:CAMPEP_0185769520 /NCGR_PEP_ID=MMETSP1174-20130828/54516_1 /TAXON_ID=35687 /ORGANISM="Dictyocha speculum, Strain CCMP1381" /LENGTH=44 /DNA_ID= /DNA_START= /DNA_END= /DNA_ORIENTATION=